MTMEKLNVLMASAEVRKVMLTAIASLPIPLRDPAHNLAVQLANALEESLIQKPEEKKP
jgi:hypothetical protein